MTDSSTLLPQQDPFAGSSLTSVVAEAIAERSQGRDLRAWDEFSSEDQGDLLRRAQEISASRDDIIRRGQAVYAQQLRAQLEVTHKGKFLVINVDTGEYETDDNDLNAMRKAQAKFPGAALYLVRIGEPVAYRLRRVGGASIIRYTTASTGSPGNRIMSNPCSS